MTYKNLPDLDTLLYLRRTHSFKELGTMFGVNPSTLQKRLSRAEYLMRETKHLAWKAWEEKQRRKPRQPAAGE